MRTLLIVLGIVWASPVTLTAFLLYVLPIWALGWYEFKGREGLALVWYREKDKCPKWFNDVWDGWAGNSIGNVHTYAHDPDLFPTRLIFEHELVHTRQVMMLGVFQPILYVVFMFVLWVMGKNPYTDNYFEQQARREALKIVTGK